MRAGEDFVDAFDAVEGRVAVDRDFGEEFEDNLLMSLALCWMFRRGRKNLQAGWSCCPRREVHASLYYPVYSSIRRRLAFVS
jgi:hypothetical protein